MPEPFPTEECLFLRITDGRRHFLQNVIFEINAGVFQQFIGYQNRGCHLIGRNHGLTEAGLRIRVIAVFIDPLRRGITQYDRNTQVMGGGNRMGETAENVVLFQSLYQLILIFVRDQVSAGAVTAFSESFPAFRYAYAPRTLYCRQPPF